MSTSGGRGDEEERRNVHRARSQIERPNGQRRTDARFIHEAVANQTALSRAEAVISQANKIGPFFYDVRISQESEESSLTKHIKCLPPVFMSCTVHKQNQGPP